MIINRYGMDIDLSYEHKTACPKCVSVGRDNSGDNLHVYGLDGDGEYLGGRCFSCNYTIPSEQWMRDNKPINLEDLEYELKGELFNEEVHDGIKSITSFESQNYRGISRKTSQYFGVRYEASTKDGSIAKTYYPTTKGVVEGVPLSEAICGYKIRNHPKTFHAVGETGADCDLFMQFRFPTHKGFLLICAGEIDSLSAYQMLRAEYDKNPNNKYDEIAVVSPLTGEGGAAAHLRKHYEWLDQFKKIIVCMDNDEAGRLATEAIVEVLPRGKMFVMNLRHGDVNEYLKNNDAQSFINDFWGNRPYTPDGIKSSVDGFREIKDELLKPRITLPTYMHELQDMMGGGIQQGRIVNIIAATSAGKSTHANRMVYHWIFNSPIIPTIISLEATAAQYNIDLLQTHLGLNFTFGKTGEEIVEFIEQDWVQDKIKELCFREDGSPRYYIIDERSGDISGIEEQMEIMHKKHGSKLFLVDVLTDLLRGSNSEKSEDHMTYQKMIAKEGATIINVHHTTKIPLGMDGKVRKVTEFDAFGTSSFVQSAAINIVLNRDKMDDNDLDKNTTSVSLPKCRGGKTGDAGKWYFDFQTSTVHDLGDFLKANPHMANQEEG